MSKIIFVTCMYNRPQISNIYLAGLKRLQELHDFQILVATSDKESADLCKENGIPYFEHKNLPLGDKNNRLFQEALKQDWDYIIHSGDDNLMSNRLFVQYLQAFIEGHDYIKPQGLYFLDSRTKNCLNFNPTNTFGAFRAFSRSMVEKIGWKYICIFRQNVNEYKEQHTYRVPKYFGDYLMTKSVVSKQAEIFELWKPDINAMLDFSSETTILQANIKPYIIKTESPQVIDIKSEQNIWKFEKYWLQSTEVKTEEVYKLLGSEEIELIKTL